MVTEDSSTEPLPARPDPTHTDATVVSSTSKTMQADFAGATQATQATQSTNHVALPRGYILQEYTIEAVLGVGGFGITYLAQDNNLQRSVAIKEYLPNDLAIRVEGHTVIPRTGSDTHGYRTGLDRFLAEARVLATFRHHNIVRVGRFFEANSTAYMVMDYEQGESLRSWIGIHGPMDEATAMRMFVPLLDGLDTVHRAGIVHRDIKPANIYVRDSDGSLVLLDFGAARQTTGGSSKSLTSIITPGYAPFEQYHTRGAQGPWTDLYALGGVLYWVVTGQKPIEAPSRVKDDPMPPAVVAAAGRFSEPFLRAIDWALTVDEAQRPHSVTEFRAVLTGAAPVPTRTVPAPAAVQHAAPAKATNAGAKLKYALAGSVLVLAGILAFVFVGSGRKDDLPSVAQNVAAPETPAANGGGPTAKAATTSTLQADAKAVAKPGVASKNGATKGASAVASRPEAAGGPMAVLTFQIVPPGESAELIIDDRSVGRTPKMSEYRLPAGKHKVEINGNKRPYFYHYWVDLAPNEKKNLWAKFSDE